jgi:hypothetical protein
MTITQKDNLFNVLGAEVAKSRLTELYLPAGADFATANNSGEVYRVLQIAKAVAPGSRTAAEALAAHYNTCVEVQTSHQMFCDGCGGFVTTDGLVVQFLVRKIADEPEVYRVLFVRLDALELAVSMKEKLDDLDRRVKEVEFPNPKASGSSGAG